MTEDSRLVVRLKSHDADKFQRLLKQKNSSQPAGKRAADARKFDTWLLAAFNSRPLK